MRHILWIEPKIWGTVRCFGMGRDGRRVSGLFGSGGLLAAGCSIETTNGAKVADLDYEIVEEAQIPEKVKAVIEEKRRLILKRPMNSTGICTSARVWRTGDGRLQHLHPGSVSDVECDFVRYGTCGTEKGRTGKQRTELSLYCNKDRKT